MAELPGGKGESSQAKIKTSSGLGELRLREDRSLHLEMQTMVLFYDSMIPSPVWVGAAGMQGWRGGPKGKAAIPLQLWVLGPSNSHRNTGGEHQKQGETWRDGKKGKQQRARRELESKVCAQKSCLKEKKEKKKSQPKPTFTFIKAKQEIQIQERTAARRTALTSPAFSFMHS